MMKKYLGITLLATSMLLLGCSSNDDSSSDAVMDTTDMDTDTDTEMEVETGPAEFLEAQMDYGNSVMGIVVAQPDLTLTESAILGAADQLDITLNDAASTWTLFAPNDTAMEGVNANRAALLAHIHAGFVNRDALTGLVGSTLSMTGGEPHEITMAEDGVTLQIGGVNIVQGGVVADNGILFKIDGVLQ